VEELESQLKTSQKSQKDKQKTIDDIKSKLELSTSTQLILNDKVISLESQNDLLQVENDTIQRMIEKHETTNKQIQLQHKQTIENLILKYQIEKDNLINEHSIEIKAREDKLEMLKKEIAGVFKDNSWERQLQIDELNKELKRSKEECELHKYKLKGFKSKYADPSSINVCKSCEDNNSKIIERESLIAELVAILKKMRSQLNITDDLLRITANKNYNESLKKLNINLEQTIGNNNNNKATSVNQSVNLKIRK
jgi:hypothetical protein